MYYVVAWVDGRLVREPAGHDRKTAERQLRAIDHQIDERMYAPPDNVGLSDWIDEWLAGLDVSTASTRSYGSSLAYAKTAIGNEPLRKLTTSDVRLFLGQSGR